MISESTIEQVLEQFESQAIDFESAIKNLGKRQPAVLSFLLSDNESVLTEDEQDYLLYLATVIFTAVEKEQSELPPISPDVIEEAEEANWELMGSMKGKTFREQLDPFFENYSQEDLLAFVEDALSAEPEDEDGEVFSITAEGREPMFVTLKTLIDVLTAE